MKIFKVFIIVTFSLFFISTECYGCGKLRLMAAHAQKTLPGYKGSEIVEKYTFICKKSALVDVNITGLWQGSEKKGRLLDYKIMKYDGEKVTDEELKSLRGVKLFAIVAVYKYPAEHIVNKSEDSCPIGNFNGKAIIVYLKNEHKKYLKVSGFDSEETIRRR